MRREVGGRQVLGKGEGGGRGGEWRREEGGARRGRGQGGWRMS